MLRIVDRNRFETFRGFLFRGRYRGGAKKKYMAFRLSFFVIVLGVAFIKAPLVSELALGYLVLFHIGYIISAYFSYYSILEISNNTMKAKLFEKTWFRIEANSVKSCEKLDWFTDAYRVVLNSGIVREFILYYETPPEQVVSFLRKGGVTASDIAPGLKG